MPIDPALKRDLQAKAVDTGELEATKDNLRGSILLASEDCDHLMMRLAKNEINFGHYIPLEEIIAGLLKVSAGEILELARDLFRPEAWGLTLLGPVEEDGGYSLA